MAALTYGAQKRAVGIMIEVRAGMANSGTRIVKQSNKGPI